MSETVKCPSCRRVFKFPYGSDPPPDLELLRHKKGVKGYHCPGDGLWFPTKKDHDEACKD